MAKNLELSLKIKALVDGVNHIKGLANEVKGLADKAGTPMPDPTTPVREGARETSLAVRDLVTGLTGLFSLAALKQFVTGSVQQFSQAESAFRGLESVANFTGVGIGRAMQEAGKLAADGLITTQEASKALQNLLSRGYDIDEAVQTLTRLKDSAAFNRQAHLSLGEAVVSASEGLKNENSILVDNAGVTKNVSILWKEYAAEIGKTVSQLTQQEKIQAEVNGILRETEAQAGNAARAAQGMQGQFARLDATTNQFKASLGEALVPAVITVTRTGVFLVNEFLKPMVFLAKAAGIAAGEFAGSLGALFDLIKTRDLAAFRQRRAELSALADQLRQETALSLADGQLNITAAPDSGKRRTLDTSEPAAPGTPNGGKNSRTAAQLRTEFDASFVLLKDALARERAELDASLEQRLISRRDYWANVNRLNQAGFDAERERLLKERAELVSNQSRLNGDADAVAANKQRIQKIDTDLIILERERLSVAGESARKQAKAEQELEQALNNVRLRVRELTGAADDNDRRAAVANGFSDLLAQVAGDVEATALIERLIDVEAADANLNALERRWSLALNNLRNAQQSVHIQQQQGLITTAQAQQLITAAQQQTAVELQQLLPLMEQSANAIGPDAVARVQAWKNELAQVQTVVDPVAAAINTSVKNAFTDMFVSIANGTKSAKTAFLDFARSVLDAINRIAAQRLAESLFGGLLGGAGASGGSGGIGGFFSRLFQGFADGGLVTGPGSGTSDSIPARLSAGEYVLNAAAVRRIGVDFLHRLNGASSPPRLLGGRLGFADGGLVGDLSLSPAAAPTVNNTVRIVNSVDPRITKDFLTSSEGEKVILNIISRNNAALKQALS